MKRIYLDYAASTPVDERVVAAMAPYWTEKFGNPGSLHRYGQEAGAAVFNARLKIARILGCDPEEIIFTATASEANNFALRGAIRMWNAEYGIWDRKVEEKPKIIISAIEHESIMETARDLEKEGAEVVVISVSKEGILDLEKFRAALDRRTIMVSVMYANNEVGVIQPISKIANIVRNFRINKAPIANSESQIAKNETSDQRPATSDLPLFHTDAVQAFQYLSCKPEELGVDLMTLSAHKIYGPKGIGMLYVKKTRKQENKKAIGPIITGGKQEWGMRAGTENVPYIVGFAEAVEMAEKMRAKEAKRVTKLRDYFWAQLQKSALRLGRLERPRSGNKDRYSLSLPAGRHGLSKRYLDMALNGSCENRLPNNLNVYFPGSKAQELLIALDINGVAASSGSACSAHTTEPSKVIVALGYLRERALSSLRFSLGRGTTKAEIDKTIKILVRCIKA